MIRESGVISPSSYTEMRTTVFILSVVIGVANCQNRTFPDDFLLGFATSNYQIEGGWNEDGRGECLWDHWVHTNPNHIADQSNGDVAADSYHKYKEDVQMLKNVGAQFYRFSISWSRILPEGITTKVNQAGVDYYNNLINELIENGIQPMAALVHGDFPQRLEDIGGWTNPITGNYYIDYAKVAFTEFGDRVKWWITFNEPFETGRTDYAGTGAPPGLNLPGIAEYLVAYSILQAHARAYHLYDEEFRPTQKGKIGIVLGGGWNEPASNSSEDIAAADRANQFLVGMFSHPIFSAEGDFPKVIRDRIDANSMEEGWSSSRLPYFSPEMVQYIRGTSDFFGMNHYTTTLITNAEPPTGPTPSVERDMGLTMSQDPSWPQEAVGNMKMVPWGMRRFLNWVRSQYNNVPVFITESGYVDKGELEDNGRVDMYNRYLQEVLNAIYEDGCNVLGYLAWSLMDNFEWGLGYSVRYGVYYVDFEDPNRPRTPKKSAGFFKNITSSRTLPPVSQEYENMNQLI